MQKIVNPLLDWYSIHKRMLPWRMDRNPYHVWVSEIMLQQTRIEAVIDYYHRFMSKLPTIEDLATCPQDKLLKLWEGLGYYNRVRNLQKSAQIIMEKYQGKFPNTYQEILSLPGIGEYTASAISSICFSLKEATVDGNVLRVYMRINNCYDNVDDNKVRKRVREELMEIMPEPSGDFNEAMMELGETVCIPNGNPKCEECPIRDFCRAYHQRTFLELPVKQDKKEKKEEFYTVLLLVHQNMIAIQKRKNIGLLRNMWQFPNEENHFNHKQLEEYLTANKMQSSKIEKSISYTHIFTHKKWNMCSYLIEVDKKIELDGIIWVSLEELEREYALPTAFQPFKKYLEKEVK